MVLFLNKESSELSNSQKFLPGTKQQAWLRQDMKCAICGEEIYQLGKVASVTHKFGEHAEAHHMKHVKQGGSRMLENCVILCYSCHLNVHEGGRFRNKEEYLITTETDYPYFYKL
jgi:5-methylcytosine-specific restriction endonuclease McrA